MFHQSSRVDGSRHTSKYAHSSLPQRVTSKLNSHPHSPVPLFAAAILELERQDPSSFQPLPFHYQEIAHTLFTAGDHASLPREVFGDNHQKIRDLVNLVQKTRYNKILQGLSTMQEAAVVKVNYLSAMELNAVRSFFTGALDQFHKYGKMGDMDAAVAGVVVNAGGATGTAAATAAAGEQQQPEQEQPLRQLRRDR